MMRYRATSQTIFRVIDGEVVALHLGTGQYYTMNVVGTRLWELLEQGASYEEMIERISREFEESDEKISEDVAAFLADLKACELIAEA